MNDDDLILVRRGDLRTELSDVDNSVAWQRARRRLAAAVNAPVSPVVPLTRLREWIAERRAVMSTWMAESHDMDYYERVCGHLAELTELAVLLDDLERTTDGD